jgi:glycosyltransferase involved in cell wall biosynthesis
MKIGFDISQTGNGKAGCGYFADSLVHALAQLDSENEYLLYQSFGDFFWDPQSPESATCIEGPRFSVVHLHPTFEEARTFWSMKSEEIENRLGQPDIVHSNNFFCPKGLRNARLVYTLYDLSFLEHPEWHTEENRLGCFNGVFEASLSADLIIAISEYSRRHFLQVFPHFPQERIEVVHLASRFSAPRERPCPTNLPDLEPQGFWLNVGTIEPRKNQLRLLKAYSALKASGAKTMPLVMAGGYGWLMDDFKRSLLELGLAGDVRVLGYVDDSTLQWLYENCFALVYPSLFEGFGLPVLEAMSLGAPVIASELTSIPEIIGDAGLLVDPLSEKSISSAMQRLLMEEGLRDRLKSEGMQRAKCFSWENAARSVLRLYSSLLAKT